MEDSAAVVVKIRLFASCVWVQSGRSDVATKAREGDDRKMMIKSEAKD